MAQTSFKSGAKPKGRGRNSPPGGYIERILIGDVVTMDGKGMRATAIAISDGRIAAVGSRCDVLALREARTEVLDYKGAAIIPGFNDTHAHMDTEGLKLIRPSLGRVRSIGSVLARIRAIAAKCSAGEWIVTMPIGDPPYYFGGPSVLAERRMPNRAELDNAAPDNPVYILPPSGFWGAPPSYSALNSIALRLNRVDRNTEPRISGIEIVKDRYGEPTGVIIDNNPRECAELDLLPAVPKFTVAERRDGIVMAMKRYHAKGTTSVYEGHGCSPEILAIYRGLWEEGKLTMRTATVISPAWSTPEEAEPIMRDWLGFARGRGLGDAMFRLSGLYIHYGGDPLTASIARARGNETGFWCNLWQAVEPDKYEALCMLAARFDLRVHTVAHAGRQAEIIPILQRIDSLYDLSRRRWVVEHLSVTAMEDLHALKKLGVGVTLIPTHHLWKTGAQFISLDDEQAARVVPARQLCELDIPFAAGTDNTPNDPLAVMRALILRSERVSDRVIGPSARLTAEQALRAITCGGAWFTFEETTKGRLLPGYRADCTVLSHNPLDVAPNEIDSISCLATYVGGVSVYSQ